MWYSWLNTMNPKSTKTYQTWNSLLPRFRVARHREFELWHSKIYPIALVSPCFLMRGTALSPGGWAALQKQFKKHFKGSEAAHSPYINVLYNTSKELKAARQNLAGYGLAPLAGQTHHVNSFEKQRSTKLPPHFSVTHGDFLDKAILKDYGVVQKAVFPNGMMWVKKNIEFTKSMRIQVHTTLIYNKAGNPVGSAGVSFKENQRYGWLFGGSVLEAYRRKGLWTALVGLRQALTRGYGIETWCLITQTPAILNIGDSTTKMTVFGIPPKSAPRP